MSGGPFHFIARYPKDGKQGPLFGLLRRIEQSIGDHKVKCEPFDVLWGMLRRAGWYVASDGKLRSHSNGSVVGGNEIRDEFAPVRGVVPESGPDRARAEAWAKAFCQLLSHPLTFSAQIDYCISWLLTTQREVEMKTYRLVTGLPVLEDLTNIRIEDPAIDLALCVYHSHSVNAPGAAVDCLKTVSYIHGAREFPNQLIRALGKKKYGAWDKRYTKTREVAMKSGLWPLELFNGSLSIMPENL
jgi:hypothetical protein